MYGQVMPEILLKKKHLSSDRCPVKPKSLHLDILSRLMYLSTMPKIPLEKTFVAKVLLDLRKLPKTYARKNMAASMGGIPDIEACINGFYVGLECKRSVKSLPTALQLYTIEKIKYAGGFACVIHPDNWSEVYLEITKFLERK